jgi:hypothetical protein
MKFWLFLGLICLFPLSAFSYIEDKVEGEAEFTAGEQNTNLYRLNATGSLSIKKLKKIDELVARNPKVGANPDMSEIEKMVDSEAGRTQQLMEDILKDTKKRVAVPTKLKKLPDSGIYALFRELKPQNVRDRAIVLALREKLQRRR